MVYLKFHAPPNGVLSRMVDDNQNTLGWSFDMGLFRTGQMYIGKSIGWDRCLQVEEDHLQASELLVVGNEEINLVQ